MTTVEIKDQASLPLSRCVELVLSSIRYRLFRSIVTVVIIALAVAFLMVMLSEDLIVRRVALAAASQSAPRRLVDRWVSRLSAPLSEADLAADLATLTGPDDPRWLEFKAWGRMPAQQDSQPAQIQQIARQQLVYSQFFDGLSEGFRHQLVGTRTGADVFEYLGDPAASYQRLAQFAARLQDSDRKLPTSMEQFKAFLAQYRSTAPLRQAILEGHRDTLVSVKALLGPLSPLEALAGADTQLKAKLSRLGYRMSADDLRTLRREASLELDAARIVKLLDSEIVKQRLVNRLKIDLPSADAPHLLAEASTAEGAQWLHDVITSKEFTSQSKGVAPSGLPPALSATRIREAAEDQVRSRRLAEIEGAVAQAGESALPGGLRGLSGRTLWLILVSFLVCVVGIANAMLMSVTERFREIATMKCLGATDGFIRVHFIIESIMQGLAGGVVGSILGFILGCARSWASYGRITFSDFPVLGVLGMAGASMLVGMVVSALAAVYPAHVAARLAPMEAMRIE